MMVPVEYRRALGAAILCSTFAFAPLAAQGPVTPAMQEVVRLAQDGYGDSARAVVARTLSKTSISDPLYPEALYTAATVAKSGDDMRSQFSRVVIEFSSSAWADKALLRLAQLDYGGGNTQGAVERMRRLFNDYPTSSVLPTAALWGSRAAFERKEMQLGCDWLAKGIAAVGDDIELKNQLEYAKQRCTAGPGLEPAPMRADSLRTKPGLEPAPRRDDSLRSKPAIEPAPKRDDSLRAKPPATKPAETGAWRVQVAAIADKAAIRRTVQKIEAAGFRAYQVAGPRGLTKIQAGPFTTRDAAAAKVATLKKAVGGSPFPVKAP